MKYASKNCFDYFRINIPNCHFGFYCQVVEYLMSSIRFQTWGKQIYKKISTFIFQRKSITVLSDSEKYKRNQQVGKEQSNEKFQLMGNNSGIWQICVCNSSSSAARQCWCLQPALVCTELWISRYLGGLWKNVKYTDHSFSP